MASRYTALALQPANGGSFMQNVPFVIATPRPEMTNGVTIGGKTFLNGEDVVVSGTSLYPVEVER